MMLRLAMAILALSPATRPVGVDPEPWQRMLDIDAKAARIADLSADFEQQKFTALLKKPLTTSGRVFVRGSSMLWDTRQPEPSVLQINDREVRIYYPQQKTIEVYQVQQKLAQLAASPLPRLETLQKHFELQPVATAELDEPDERRFLAVRLVPIQPELREHLSQVRVLLDTDTGLIVRMEMLDADDERTVIRFSNVTTNTGIDDAQLRIAAPEDVKVTRPLAAIEGPAR